VGKALEKGRLKMLETETEQKKGEWKSKTLRTSKKQLQLGEILYPDEDPDRPVVRSQCKSASRPCPFVSCKYHLYLDVNPSTGSIKLNFPDLEVWEMQESCALDVADRGEHLLVEIGELMHITRARIQQIVYSCADKLREFDKKNGDKLVEFCDDIGNEY
jgi:hypothetical protein